MSEQAGPERASSEMGEYEDRKDYSSSSLEAGGESLAGRLTIWLDEAREADPEDYNAMTLSTVDEAGQPDARIVLLRDLDQEGMGVLFYTSYRSVKGRQLTAQPAAALTFFWPSLERQLRVRGRVEPLSEGESDRYFQSRPRPSRIGAWASDQSEVIADRTALESAREDIEARFPGEVPRPPHWGGYRLVAGSVEFWQGRPARLHDRIRYVRNNGVWIQERLQP